MTASPNHGDPPPAPLRLHPRAGGWRSTLWVLVGVMWLCAIVVACAVYTAPTVLSDWQVRDTARLVPDSQVGDGRCTTKIVVHVCDATLSLKTSDGVVTRRVNDVFSGLHVGEYAIRVMADPARLDLVTTDLGLDRLINRTITLLTVLLATLAGIVATVTAMIRNRRAAG